MGSGLTGSRRGDAARTWLQQEAWGIWRTSQEGWDIYDPITHRNTAQNLKDTTGFGTVSGVHDSVRLSKHTRPGAALV